MNLKDMSIEDLELLSYTDITYKLLKEGKTSMSTADIFKKICELLNLSENEYLEKIGDFYTSLNIDKRFALLDNGSWDLREKHSIKLEMDEEDSDFDDNSLEEEEEEAEIEEEEEENIDEINTDDDLDVDDDLDDLSVVDEDDMEEEM